MNKCFVCTPPHEGDKEKIEMIKKYCRDVVWDDMIPVAPNLSFAAFLGDDAGDRWRKKMMVMSLLPECAEFRVYCDEVTEDMLPQIRKAQDQKIPVKFFDADLKEIDYDALIINKRIGPGYRKIISESHGDHSTSAICPYAMECAKTGSAAGKPPESTPPKDAPGPVVASSSVETKLTGWECFVHWLKSFFV